MFDRVTPEQRQNIERYYNDTQYRSEVDAKFYSQQSFDDLRDLNTDDGSITESPKQVVQYHEHVPFNIVTFLLALIVVVVAVFLLSPLIMFILFPPV